MIYAQSSSAQQDYAADVAGLSGPQYNALGFGDLSYISRDDGNPDGFAVGQAVVHISASLDDSFGVFGEFSLTARESSYSVAVERLIAKYEFSDRFKLSVGRYHSPIGYWNSSFHHGAWLQTTISRPEAFKFGSKVVPIHFVGALIEGTLPESKLGLSYLAGVGNGRHENISQAGDTGDINGDSAWMIQLNSRPSTIFGLQSGLGFYADKVSPDDRPEVDEKTVSAYVVWAKESPEVLVEYLYSMHDRVIDNSFSGDVQAWYVQLAYRLANDHRDFKPYLRIEQTRVDDSDPLLGDQALNYDAGILGVRWDFNAYGALKAEFRREEFDNQGRENNFRLQVSFVLARP